MTLNIEDSLADLLGDNSNDDDNDSFFENSFNVIKRPAKISSSAGKAKLSKGSENLFGITEEDLDVEMSRSRPTATSTPRISNDDGLASDDDDLGFDPKKPKAASTKLDFFDDILGSTIGDSKRSAASTTTIAPTPATRRRDDRRPAISRQSTDTTTDNSNIQRPKTSTGRRGSGMSNVLNTDPLGLFTQTPKDTMQTTTASNLSTPMSASKKRGTTADWLGLNVAAETDEEPTAGRGLNIETRLESPKTPRTGAARAQTENIRQPQQRGYDILRLNDSATADPNEPADVTLMHEETTEESGNQRTALTAVAAPTAQSILQLNTMNLETRGAIGLLQQQESQLTLAAQMKQQERALLDMQRRQDTLLQQQERQFQSLMQQQVQRQQQLEENIKMQQQRINAHIQLMLTQPVGALETLPTAMLQQNTVPDGESVDQGRVPATMTTSRSGGGHTVTQAELDVIQIETDLRRLELEKQRLEELVANMKVNYEREIEMIETTYKKQIKVLDEHTSSLENRLRAEITEIEEYYKQKLTTLETEHQRSKSDWETENSTLKQDHEDELRRLRKAHEEDLLVIREEHRNMLETVQRSKMLEFAAVQDNNSYVDQLKAASANLTEATSDLQVLRDHLQSKLETLNLEKQQELESRERRLEDKERRLQLTEAAAEAERDRLMKLVATLEQQLTTLAKETAEENWQLRLKLSALEAEKAAFEREREYAREQMLRDERRLSALKEQQIAESQRIAQELQEQRRQFQIEKTKYETELKLRPNFVSNLEKERSEIEAAIKCAQDAARQSDAERQRYYTLQHELELRKRDLIDAEASLRVKQEQLSNELKACHLAEQQAQEASQRARLTEQQYQKKLQILQQRTRELAEKESLLAEERKLLAQQRIAIKEAQTKLTTRLCPKCQQDKASDKSQENCLETKKEETVLKDLPMETRKPIKGIVNSINMPLENRPGINIVDRLLDENIAMSLQRMQTNTSPPTVSGGNSDRRYGHNAFEHWSPVGLDDDSKTLALYNFEGHQFDVDRVSPNYLSDLERSREED